MQLFWHLFIKIITLCSGNELVSRFLFSHGATALVAEDLLSVEDSFTLRHTTLGRTPLDERSTRRKDQYLTTNNTHKRQDIHASGGIQIRNPSKRATADPRLRPLAIVIGGNARIWC